LHKDILAWEKADFLLLDYTSRQRKVLPTGLESYLAMHEPVERVMVQGIPCVDVYDLRAMPSAMEALTHSPLVTTWGDRFVLYTAEIQKANPRDAKIPVSLYLRPIAGGVAASKATELSLAVVDATGVEVATADVGIPGATMSGSVMRMDATLDLPEHVEGPLELVVALVDKTSGDALPWQSAAQPRPVAEGATIARLSAGTPGGALRAHWMDPVPFAAPVADHSVTAKRKSGEKKHAP
jgi:hypothetical protein